jgi:GMP synthase (glutamine-hydrolysing)
VDSAVAAALVHRAIGDRLTNVFVDNGVLRKGEFQDTIALLEQRVGMKVIGVDAAERFLARLKGVTDPEEKRKRIGAEFIAVFADQARRLSATYSLPGAGHPVSRRDRIRRRSEAPPRP